MTWKFQGNQYRPKHQYIKYSIQRSIYQFMSYKSQNRISIKGMDSGYVGGGGGQILNCSKPARLQWCVTSFSLKPLFKTIVWKESLTFLRGELFWKKRKKFLTWLYALPMYAVQFSFEPDAGCYLIRRKVGEPTMSWLEETCSDVNHMA